MTRSVFYLSDSTGITAETLGRALLTQFEGLDYRQTTLPFVDDEDKAAAAAAEIDAAAVADGMRPLVFSTLTDARVYERVACSKGLVLDLFHVFLRSLETELDKGSLHATGRFHGLYDHASYEVRIDAVDYTLKHDDGASVRGYENADLILVGVSRSGKTPTCVYLSMHFGIRAANYPLTEDDIATGSLPAVLAPHRERLFGLSIDPERLRHIRVERRPDSRYASLAQCRREVRAVETLFRRERIDFLDTSRASVEEISSRILQRKGFQRLAF